ncbi:MAG: hypothetical protein BHV65_12270 [Alistipes sp. 58_9_plus]|nr:MAG: hypothetical protein BHV65_12270 [Alistipes sp. 58_9_plus]
MTLEFAEKRPSGSEARFAQLVNTLPNAVISGLRLNSSAGTVFSPEPAKRLVAVLRAGNWAKRSPGTLSSAVQFSNRLPTLVILGAPANASGDTVFSWVQPLNIEAMLVHEVQPLMILPPISSSAVQPANRLENEVTLVSPLNSPSGMLFSASQSLKQELRSVSSVHPANRSAGISRRASQLSKALEKVVTRANGASGPGEGIDSSAAHL